jgi:muramoyltetrapeptide carboxypeptidase
MTAVKIQPAFLREGDLVAIVSPSFCIEEKKISEAVRILESWGLKVKLGRHVLRSEGPFAGSDEERLADIQEMTSDPDVKAVFCSRGGYGILKIIDRIDFSSLRRNPKWYVGFSDITVLHMWLSEVCGMVSIHGEMPVNFTNAEKSPGTILSLQQSLFGQLESCVWEGSVLRPRNASGEITGGNLSLLYTLAGTRVRPKTAGKILFIEEVGEYLYHIDRMLTSFKLAGMLEGLAALIVGGMTDISETRIPWGRSIENLTGDIVKEYDYPVFFNYPAGHISDNQAFYIGRKAEVKVVGTRAVLSWI